MINEALFFVHLQEHIPFLYKTMREKHRKQEKLKTAVPAIISGIRSN